MKIAFTNPGDRRTSTFPTPQSVCSKRCEGSRSAHGGGYCIGRRPSMGPASTWCSPSKRPDRDSSICTSKGPQERHGAGASAAVGEGGAMPVVAIFKQLQEDEIPGRLRQFEVRRSTRESASCMHRSSAISKAVEGPRMAG